MSGWFWFLDYFFYYFLEKGLFIVWWGFFSPIFLVYVPLYDSKHLFPHSFASYLFKREKFKATLAAEGKAC